MNGIYSANYTGAMGSGSAVLIMKNGEIAGADVTGGNYQGEYALDDTKGVIKGKLILTIPAGTQLAMGGSAGTIPLTFEIPFTFPKDFANGQVLPLDTVYGPLNVMFNYIRDVI